MKPLGVGAHSRFVIGTGRLNEAAPCCGYVAVAIRLVTLVRIRIVTLLAVEAIGIIARRTVMIMMVSTHP